MTGFGDGAETIVQNINRLMEQTLEKRPAMATVVRPFAAVFITKAMLVDNLSRELDLNGFEFEAERLTAGAPLACHLPFDRVKTELDRSFKTFLPTLQTSFPAIADKLLILEKAHNRIELDLVRLAGDFLEGNPRSFENQADRMGISPGCLEFVANFTISAVLQALEKQFRSMPALVAWKKGYCPICGSLPSIGFLAKASTTGSEFIKGGGGQKYLHCALCGHDWRINRNVCPACETDDKDFRFYLQVQDENAERVDICRQCGLYLLLLDTRQSMVEPHLDLASVSLLHLEILARQKGYHPMTWTPWNREE